MWEWAWESACPKEWGCRKKAQDLAQLYKINGSTNGFENKYIASFKVKFYNCEKRIGWFDSGVEKLAAQNVASQGPIHDCKCFFSGGAVRLPLGRRLGSISMCRLLEQTLLSTASLWAVPGRNLELDEPLPILPIECTSTWCLAANRQFRKCNITFLVKANWHCEKW